MPRRKLGCPNPWATLGAAAMLAAEAQGVVALRILRIAGGGRRARAEAARMITEKGTAFLAAQAAAAAVLPIGGTIVAADTIITAYRRSVRDNHRRLTRPTG